MKKCFLIALAAALVLASCANPTNAAPVSQDDALKIQKVMAAAMVAGTPTPSKGVLAFDYTIDSTVVVDGQTYTVKGGFNYVLTTPDDPAVYPNDIVMVCKASNFSIKGPDLDCSYDMNYTYTMHMTSATTGSVSLVGTINGTSIVYSQTF